MSHFFPFSLSLPADNFPIIGLIIVMETRRKVKTYGTKIEKKKNRFSCSSSSFSTLTFLGSSSVCTSLTFLPTCCLIYWNPFCLISATLCFSAAVRRLFMIYLFATFLLHVSCLIFSLPNPISWVCSGSKMSKHQTIMKWKGRSPSSGYRSQEMVSEC